MSFGSASFTKNDIIATHLTSSLNSSNIWIQNQFKKSKFTPKKKRKRGQKGNTLKPETFFIKICKYEEG